MQNVIEAFAYEEFSDDDVLLIGQEEPLHGSDDFSEAEDTQDTMGDADESKMDPASIDVLIDELERLCGPTPEMDSRMYTSTLLDCPHLAKVYILFLPELILTIKVPEHFIESIQRHDS
jgi:hypothetical protein